jgi:hypothetical protein
MPSRPDIRDLAANVKEAFADADRDTLLDVLTFVVKEYVVEGPPPMLVHQVENLADLAGLSFAQLVTTLQTRLEHPELALFVVDGEHVSVRVGGVTQPLQAGRQVQVAPAAELPRPSAGVRVVEAAVSRPPPQPAAAPSSSVQPMQPMPQPTPGSAPPPIRGLSMRGRPSGDDAEAAPQQGAPPAAPPAAAQPAPAPKPDKPEGGSGDDASARFSLLELD